MCWVGGSGRPALYEEALSEKHYFRSFIPQFFFSDLSITGRSGMLSPPRAHFLRYENPETGAQDQPQQRIQAKHPDLNWPPAKFWLQREQDGRTACQSDCAEFLHIQQGWKWPAAYQTLLANATARGEDRQADAHDRAQGVLEI